MEPSFYEKQLIYKLNNQIREKLSNEAQKQNSPAEQIQFVADYFLNKLPVETIAKIDDVKKSEVRPFIYDYSFLDDFSSALIRTKKPRQYAGNFYTTTQGPADDARFGTEHIKIYPTIYPLKMGTCVMFASEIQRFCHEFGVNGKIVDNFSFCYDNYDGKSTTGEVIKTDQICKMHHYYNIITIDGISYKLDIAGALTALDFNQNHPENIIFPDSFYFSKDIQNNPYDKLVSLSSSKVKFQNVKITNGFQPE